MLPGDTLAKTVRFVMRGSIQKSEPFNAKSICRCVAYCSDFQFLGYSFAFKDIIYERNFAVLDHILGLLQPEGKRSGQKNIKD